MPGGTSAQPHPSDVVDEMLRAWKAVGGDPSTLRNALAEINVDGEEILANVAAEI